MTKRIISLVIIAVTVLSVLPMTATAATAGFSDVKPNNWFYNSVNFVADKGLMAGTSGGKFSPTTSMSRAMVVTILWHLEGDPYAYTNELTDVPKNKWFSTPIYWAYRSGVVSGYGNGKFGTNDLVTREQLVTMLKNYTEFKDITTDKRTALTAFSDASAISGWAKEAVTWAVAEGLISGVGNGRLNPKGTASRAEAAAMMMNYYNNILTAVPEVPEQPEEPEQPEQPETPEEPDLPDTPTVPDSVDKYNYEQNALVNNTAVNEHTLPSFDVNSTGFVKAGTKLSDLKGKTLKLYTPDSTPSFSYKTGGTKTDEWAWFLALKNEIGLSVKKEVVTGASSVELPLRDMHAGLQCDIIYTNGSNYPNALAISRGIDDLIDTNGLKKSLGLCTKTMDMLKWGNTYRAISPIGVVDVLWYNANASNVDGLDDPHMLWKSGEWNWQALDTFLR
ncbi:MAG: S-layer homology domain-containing protein, partial [Clostridia bacterium]|nr:S-layer homology domain-containing protein [Clostridia bacterium]